MSARALPEELRRRPVGVFDSGVGGLTVLHELLVQLPHEDFVYIADAVVKKLKAAIDGVGK